MGFQQFEKFKIHYFLIETKLSLNGVFVFFPLLVYCVFYFGRYEKRAGLWSVLSLVAIIALLIACLLTRNRSVIASLMAIMAVSAVAVLWSEKMMNDFFGRFASYIRYGAPASLLAMMVLYFSYGHKFFLGSQRTGYLSFQGAILAPNFRGRFSLFTAFCCGCAETSFLARGIFCLA